MSARRLRFGPLTLDPDSGLLVGVEGPVVVPPLVGRALSHLAARRGEVVPREALRDAVWEGVHVSDDAVHQLVRKVRVVLGDAGRPHRFLRTVGHSGYLLAPEGEFTTFLQDTGGAVFGREGLRERAGAAVGPGRVVVLIGPAGIGKSAVLRLLLDAAPAAARVDLGGCEGEDDVAVAVATALGHPEAAADGLAAVGRAVAARARIVLGVDDADGCREPLARALAAWRVEAPDAAWVVTSRRPIGVPDEVAIPVGPIDAAAARTLLIARAGDPRDDLEAHRAIERILADLDGIPLALELAAERARALGYAAVADRLGEVFRLLVARGGADARHPSLRAALEASVAETTPAAHLALAQASVFVGPFTVDAAEEALDLGDTWVIDALHELVEAGLIRRAGAGRLVLGRPVRAFAAALLDRVGGREAAERRHGLAFAKLGTDDALDALDAHGGGAARAALLAARDDLFAACERAIARQDPDVAVPTLRAAWAAVVLTGPPRRVLALAARVAAITGLAGAHRVDALRTLADAARLSGDLPRGLDAARAAADGAIALGDVRRHGRALARLGSILALLGRHGEAREAHEAAAALAGAAGDARTVAIIDGNLGNLHARQGRAADARHHYLRALDGHRAVGNRRVEAAVLGQIASLDLAEGRVDQAIDGYEEAIARHAEVGDQRFALRARVNRSAALVDAGRIDEAAAALDAALAEARGIGNARLEVLIRCNLASVEAMCGRVREARAHLDEARVALGRAPDPRLACIAAGMAGELDVTQRRLPDATSRLSDALRCARELGDPVLAGRWITGLAEVASLDGAPERAAALAAEAAALLDVPSATRERLELARVRVGIALASGDGAAARALAEQALAACANPALRADLARRLPALPERSG